MFCCVWHIFLLCSISSSLSASLERICHLAWNTNPSFLYIYLECVSVCALTSSHTLSYRKHRLRFMWNSVFFVETGSFLSLRFCLVSRTLYWPPNQKKRTLIQWESQIAHGCHVAYNPKFSSLLPSFHRHSSSQMTKTQKKKKKMLGSRFSVILIIIHNGHFRYIVIQ